MPSNFRFTRMLRHLTILCAVSVACHSSHDEKTTKDNAPPGQSAAAGVASTSLDSGPGGSTKPKCEATGRWARCSVEKRLENAGFVLVPAPAAAKRSGFSVAPIAYTLGHARLELFLYPDERALGRDLAQIDTVKVAPVGGTNAWETTPVFVRSANLVAVFLTDNPRQAERLTLALTAGAPQPAAPQKLKPLVSTP